MSSDEAAQHPIKQKLKSAVISVLAGDAYNNSSVDLMFKSFGLVFYRSCKFKVGQKRLK
jgi:hypothetical protein